MGWFFLIFLGLPVIALVWAGAALLLSTIWSSFKLNVALGKVADETVREKIERGFEHARRGY